MITIITKLDRALLLCTLGRMTLVDGLTIVVTRGYVISGLPDAVRFQLRQVRLRRVVPAGHGARLGAGRGLRSRRFRPCVGPDHCPGRPADCLQRFQPAAGKRFSDHRLVGVHHHPGYGRKPHGDTPARAASSSDASSCLQGAVERGCKDVVGLAGLLPTGSPAQPT